MIAAPPPATVVPTAPAFTPHDGAAVSYGFGGGTLGMDFAAWRASSPQAAAVPCSARGAMQVCVAGSTPLGNGYRAHNLRYTFLDGRLAAIGFTTSIDGFDDATALLKRRFGPPTRVVRNQIRNVDGARAPHVLMVWRNGRSTIQLSDPLKSDVALSVRLSLDADAKQLPASPT